MFMSKQVEERQDGGGHTKRPQMVLAENPQWDCPYVTREALGLT